MIDKTELCTSLYIFRFDVLVILTVIYTLLVIAFIFIRWKKGNLKNHSELTYSLQYFAFRKVGKFAYFSWIWLIYLLLTSALKEYCS